MRQDAKQRYARQLSLPEWGETGQRAVGEARVLVVGVGGLGAPLLHYLCAAGVGTLCVVDDDRVSLSNLHRQVLFETADVGRLKVEAARDALVELNPDTKIETHAVRLDANNAAELIAQYDIVADGCDNFATRFVVNAECRKQGKTLISAAVMGFGGEVGVFTPKSACYACLYPNQPDSQAEPNCAEAGVLGSVVGVLGAWQATEVLKAITGMGESLAGQVVQLDMRSNDVRKLDVPKNPSCSWCGG